MAYIRLERTLYIATDDMIMRFLWDSSILKEVSQSYPTYYARI
jgi:hypothetical protein